MRFHHRRMDSTAIPGLGCGVILVSALFARGLSDSRRGFRDGQAVVQHAGSWLLLGGLRELGFYDQPF